MRYVIVSFFFLGLVFYEMSGGADFDPEATRLSRIEVPDAVEPEKREAILATSEPVLPENVTRVSLNLSSVEDIVTPARRTPARPTAPNETASSRVSEEPPTEFLPSLVGDQVIQTGPLIDSSAITIVDFSNDRSAPLRTRAAPAQQTDDTPDDIRSVTGSAVNVRSGPGTNYGVVNQLGLGDEVEVLEDSGTGWVRLRPLNGSPTGWMAAFLLTEG